MRFIFACGEEERCWLFQLVRLGDGLPKRVWTMGDGSRHICVYICDLPSDRLKRYHPAAQCRIRTFHSFRLALRPFSLSSHSTSQFQFIRPTIPQNMPFSNTSFFTSLLAIISLATSAPTFTPTNTSSPAPASHAACLTSQVTLVTVEESFTLQALTDNAVQRNWPVQIQPPSDTAETELYISNSRIPQPTFTLKNGKLNTQGANGKSFAGYLGLTISTFPPVLQSIFFGSGNTDFSDWWAAYTCDVAGKQYLELRHGRGKSTPPRAAFGTYILCIYFGELMFIIPSR